MRLLWAAALLASSLICADAAGYTCPEGKSKKMVTLKTGDTFDLETQSGDTYGKNVKCVVKFKRAKRNKCDLNFSCSSFALTAAKPTCKGKSDFFKIGKVRYCEETGPEVSTTKGVLAVLFKSNKKSKGGAGASCTATCVAKGATAAPATTAAPPATTAAPATTASPGGDRVLGEYELSAGPSNSWHHVNITKQAEDLYTWTNANGNSWSLTFLEERASAESLVYAVGEDCPYYASGYREAKFLLSTEQIEGPGKELYSRISGEAHTTGSIVTTTAGPPSANCSNCGLKTNWGSTDTLDHITEDIFVVWWDRQYEHTDDAITLIGTLSQVRADCLSNLGMADPPNPGRGFYYNVYIHHKDDLFPDGWALGQGTDPYGNPFLTIPHGSLGGRSILHEGFHVFQYSANSAGFAYAGDTQWYIESSAQWYMAQAWHDPEDRSLFMEAGAILGNPQLPVWHSFANEAPGDPGAHAGRPGWMFGVRQYGMHTLLIFLTQEAGVDRSIITDGFYANTALSPQEYLGSRMGPARFRRLFADWAAHNSAHMDYLTREQYERGLLEVTLAGDWTYFRPSVWAATDQGTVGWERPPAELTARGWAYNVWNVTNTQAASYTFEIQGDSAGSEGGEAMFEGRVTVLEEGGGVRLLSLPMDSALSGSLELAAAASDRQILLNVVSVPDTFGSQQTYGYRARITRG